MLSTAQLKTIGEKLVAFCGLLLYYIVYALFQIGMKMFRLAEKGCWLFRNGSFGGNKIILYGPLIKHWIMFYSGACAIWFN